MDILIICNCFPPDTAIAAVRPYMFAKNLAEMGHRVTILRSGDVSKKIDTNFHKDKENFRIISYKGENSVAERYEKGNVVLNSFSKRYSRFQKLPVFVQKTISLFLIPRNIYKKNHNAKLSFKMQQSALNNIRHEHFDVVFSTYSDLENVYAGEYAAKLFNCKWIMDFRDLIIQSSNSSWLWNVIMSRLQDKTVTKADICTVVSNGLKDTVLKRVPKAHVVTLYNGYEPIEKKLPSIEGDGILRLCYIGEIYGRRKEAFEYLLKALDQLVRQGRINKNYLRLEYAGSNQNEILPLLNQYGLIDTFNDHGYVTRDEAMAIQHQSDVFLVLSWNTKQEQGILTGKFYEGIRSHKPILVSVVGDLAHSELFELNQQYGYGFCFEEIGGETALASLSEFLLKAYNTKQQTHKPLENYNRDLENAFRYDKLSKQLEHICCELLKNH